MELKLKSSKKNLRNKFAVINSSAELASLLEVDYKTLNYYAYRRLSRDTYKKFTLKKKSGGLREIHAPISGLKILQTKLNYVLKTIYKPGHFVYGFCENKNIKDNAARHITGNYILNIDIKEFFPSIHFGRVKGLFKNKKFGFNEELAIVIANLCCYRENKEHSFLPQGAPTSPIISNLICYQLDRSLNTFAKNNDYRYSRYADDITFSSKKEFNENTVKIAEDPLRKGEKKIVLSDELSAIFKFHTFEINPKKLRLQEKCARQEVTGLIVNEKVNVNRQYIRYIRVVLHDWKINGHKIAEQKFFLNYDRQKLFYHPGKISLKEVMKGKINFIGDIRGKEDFVYAKLVNKYKEAAKEPGVKLPESEYERIAGCTWIVFENKTPIGTAFMLDGYGIITCRHVISGRKFLSIAKYNDPQHLMNVKEIKSSANYDLAILDFTTPVEEKYPALQKSSCSLYIGKKIFVYGYPTYDLGNQPARTPTEVVSFKNNTPPRWTCTGSLFSGNSGGPALDQAGRVLGAASHGFGNGVPTDVSVIAISNLDSF